MVRVTMDNAEVLVETIYTGWLGLGRIFVPPDIESIFILPFFKKIKNFA